MSHIGVEDTMAGNRGVFRVYLYNMTATPDVSKQEQLNEDKVKRIGVPKKAEQWNADRVKQVGDALVALFNEVIAEKTCPFMSAGWADGWCCKPQPWELLVYLVPLARYSLIKKHGGTLDPNKAGQTLA